MEYESDFSIGSIAHLLVGFVLGTNKYHLYYIPITFLFYLTYPLFKRLVQKAWGLPLLFVLTVMSQYIGILGNITWMVQGQNIFNWMFYFGAGIWLAFDFKSKEKFLNKHLMPVVLFSGISVMFLFAEMIFLHTHGFIAYATAMKPSVIFYSVAFVAFVIAINLTTSFFEYFGKYSYGIYLMHPAILGLLIKVQKHFFWNVSSLISIIIEFILLAIISYLIMVIYHRSSHKMLSLVSMNKK